MPRVPDCALLLARGNLASAIADASGVVSKGHMLKPKNRPIQLFAVALCLAATPGLADNVTDAIEQGRKAYSAGDLAKAKEALDLASQLIGQKNAEMFGKLLPAALPGWTAEKIETTAVGSVGFGISSASRRYSNTKDEYIEVQITGDSAVIMQFAAMLSNPQILGAMGKIVKLGDQSAFQSMEGDLHIVVNNRYLVAVQGNGSPNDKLAYAKAVDLAALAKM